MQTPDPDTATLANWLDWGAKVLADAGLETPRLDAKLLLQHAAGLSSAELILNERALLGQEQSHRFARGIERRTRHEPLAHIEGVCEFYGLSFLSDSRALIPRPDSEILIDRGLELIANDQPVRIADLGTGTGCLLLTLLHHRPLATGSGLDISRDALALARQNAARLTLEDRATLNQSSWTDWTGWSDTDVIVSNPPYIASHVIATLDPDVKLFDPALALDGGGDGLDAYRQIITLGAQHMKPAAWLVFEIGYDQGTIVPALMAEAGFTDISVRKDLGSRDRVVSGRQEL